MKSLLVVLISLVATQGFATTTAMTDITCRQAVGNAIYSFGISSGAVTANRYTGQVIPGKRILIVKEENGQSDLITSVVAQEVNSGASFKRKFANEFVQVVFTDLWVGSLVIADNNYGVEVLALGNMTCERNSKVSFNE
ncbi:hypothetical protein [Bdellovibrio sp. HCB274]|uniref:hypothetical protein n=1 Tax=Bdellovibrio sp. HCB274 TaxID=3394361 RepID=UPI0039B5F2E1